MGKTGDLFKKIRDTKRTFHAKTSLTMLRSLTMFRSVAQSCPTPCNPMTTAHQASLSITNSRSLLKLKSIESVMTSNHLILCHPFLLSFPASGSFPMSWFFTSGGQSIRVSASLSVLPIFKTYFFMIDWLALLAVQGTLKSLLQHRSSKPSFFSAQLSL